MHARHLIVLITATTLIACGDPPRSNNGNNGATNNGTDTSTNDGTNNDGPQTNNLTGVTNNTTAPPDFLAIAATADFSVGTSAWHAVSSVDGELDATTNDFGSGDLAVSVGTQWAYALDRNGSQVQVLERDDLSEAGLLDVSGAAATNPQFATDTNGKIYVSLYGVPEVVVATPDGDGFIVDRLDTSMFDDADDNPDASAVLADDGYVLVVLQRLEEFMPGENSALLVIDTSDDSFVDFDDTTDGVQPLDLGVTNAQANIRWTPDGNIAVGATGAYGTNDGAIVIVRRNGAGDYALGETFATEEDFGGDLLDFVFTGDGVGFVVISRPDFSTEVIGFEKDEPVVTYGVDLFASPGFAGLDSLGELGWWAGGDREDGDGGFQLVDYPRREGPFVQTDLPPAGFLFVTGAE